MGGGVGGERRDEGGLPEICGGAAPGLRPRNLWVGLLEFEKCKQSLEFGVDDQ